MNVYKRSNDDVKNGVARSLGAVALCIFSRLEKEQRAAGGRVVACTCTAASEAANAVSRRAAAVSKCSLYEDEHGLL